MAEPPDVETVLLEAPVGGLTVNADAEGGRITVEVLGADGRVLPGFSAGECVPVTGDSLARPVRWKDADLAGVKRPLRLRFRLTDAKLFSYRFGDEGASADH